MFRKLYLIVTVMTLLGVGGLTGFQKAKASIERKAARTVASQLVKQARKQCRKQHSFKYCGKHAKLSVKQLKHR